VKEREGCSSSCPIPIPSGRLTLYGVPADLFTRRRRGFDAAIGAGAVAGAGCAADLRLPCSNTYSKSIDDDAGAGRRGTHGGIEYAERGAGFRGRVWTEQTVTSPLLLHKARRPLPPSRRIGLNLHGERSLSSFDQRHALKVAGTVHQRRGLGGGTLMSGWTGRLLKEWTVLTQIGAAAVFR